MGINFPNNPTPGQTFNPVGGYQYVFIDGVWRIVESPQALTAETRNRIVNGAMQITQEFARNTNLTANAQYFADQWSVGFFSDGTLSGYANSTANYVGTDIGPYCATCVIGTADAAMAAGQWLFIPQQIEGIRIADFQWGTAGALPVVLRFKAACTAATIFAVAIRNGANNRSYVKNCTIAANTPTWFTIPISGDTTGTWPVDSAKAMEVAITLAAGSTFHAPSEGTWNVGSFIATAATSNLWATAGARFSFGAVGLYLDPDRTGVPPKWTMPDEAQELLACRRYYQPLLLSVLDVQAVSNGIIAANVVRFSPTMRIQPALTLGTHFAANFGALSETGGGTSSGNAVSIQATSAAAGRAYHYGTVTANARM